MEMINITTILDLTIFGNYIIYICSFIILSYLFDFKVKKNTYVFVFIYVLCISILFLLNINKYIPILILSIYFILLFRYKFIYILVFYVIFCSYSSFLMNLDKYMIYRYYLVHIGNKHSFWVYFIPIINIVLIKYICILYKLMFKKMKYKYDVIITFEEKVIKCKGYYDTGNTLIYNNKPVIFYHGSINGKNIEFNVASGLGNTTYTKGSAFLKGKEYDVYVASSMSSFNGCEVLLNALMI